MIEEAIKKSKAVVLVFSKSASVSQWVKGEINVAFSENKPILPFRVDKTEVEGGIKLMLNQMHWIDAYPRYKDHLPALLDSISKLLKNSSVPAPPKPPILNKKMLIIGGVVIVLFLMLLLIMPKKPKISVQTLATGDVELIVDGLSYTMKLVEGGEFQMGCDDSIARKQKDEGPVHKVTVSSFYIGETEVTQALWKAVMGQNPSFFKGDMLPVEQVSWNECQGFLRKINKITKKDFRLPTEAEWEFAARGGKDNHGFIYAGCNFIDSVAWYYYDTSDKNTFAVKTKSPNELDIYDLSGNVFEWCNDWYSDGYYSNSPSNNPMGPPEGSHRVLRGGSWDSREVSCRVSNRTGNIPDNKNGNIGFRLALSK